MSDETISTNVGYDNNSNNNNNDDGKTKTSILNQKLLFEPLKETLLANSALIQSVREQCQNNNNNAIKGLDDLIIYRFLRGCNMDLQKAVTQINGHLVYRKANRLDEIREKAKNLTQESFPFAEKYMKCYPHTVTHSFDRNGQPVSVERIGLANPTLLTKTMKLEEILQYHFYHLEHKAAMVNELSYQTDTVVRTCKILDVSGLGRQHLNRKGMAYLKTILQVSQDNYPEMLGNLYVVNTPWIFEMVWKVIKPWLNENTLSKIIILGSDYQTTLKSNIPIQNLPSFLGGECTCADKGGCVQQIDPNLGMTQLSVASRSIQTVEINISKEDLGSLGASILWEFRTISYNIAFRYKFIDEDGMIKEIKEAKKFDSDKDLISGQVTVTKPGVFTLIFDNSYSRFTTKNLLYMYEIIKRDRETEVEMSLSEALSPTATRSPNPCERTLEEIEED